jgi:hypothetical protein
MTHPDMPELPEAVAFVASKQVSADMRAIVRGTDADSRSLYTSEGWDIYDLYTADQLISFREAGIAEALALADEMEGWLRGPRIATDVHSWVGKLRALTYAATKDRHEQER